MTSTTIKSCELSELIWNKKSYLSSFNIEPQHSILYTSAARDSAVCFCSAILKHNAMGTEVADGIIDLFGRVAARVTWEDVTINMSEAGSPSTVNIGWTISIGFAIGLVDTNNRETVSIRLRTVYSIEK